MELDLEIVETLLEEAHNHLDKLNANNNNWEPLKTPTIMSRELDTRINQLVNTGILLGVNIYSGMKDAELSTTYYDTAQRDNFRLVITGNEFKKESIDEDNNKVFETFSSESMESHSGFGYCAYTLNLNGEISVFNHMGMSKDHSDDSVKAHSSMNAGNVVLCAGELKIEDGKLIEITAHSGHYQPSANQVCEALEHFEKLGIDISNTNVTIYEKLPQINPTITHDAHGHETYQYNAAKLMRHMASLRHDPKTQLLQIDDQHLRDSIDQTRNALTTYLQATDKDTGNKWYKLLQFKDSVIKKITKNPTYVGKTEAKRRVAKLMLKELDTLHGNDPESVRGQMNKIADNISTKINSTSTSNKSTISKICSSLKNEANIVRFDQAKSNNVQRVR